MRKVKSQLLFLSQRDIYWSESAVSHPFWPNDGNGNGRCQSFKKARKNNLRLWWINRIFVSLFEHVKLFEFLLKKIWSSTFPLLEVSV